MRNKLRQLISAAAAALVLTFAAPAAAFAVESAESQPEELTDGNFTYELVDGSYTITKCDPSSIITAVPEFRNGYAVTAIGSQAFAGCSFISELTIPSSVKSIGSGAFADCTSLKSIELPEGLKTISSSTFMRCSLLSDIKIPDSVTIIENYAFYGCAALTDVTLPSSLSRIGAMAFAECETIDSFDASRCENYTFQDGILYNSDKTDIVRASTSLEGAVYIENTVETIEPGAFTICTGITELYLPSSVTYIGDDAFGYCTSLKRVDFAEGLQTISDIAFKFCYVLESVDFPTTLKEIGEGAFYYCQSLSRVMIPEGVETIGNGAFVSCPELLQASVPSSVTNIGENAFGFDIDGSTSEYIAQEGFSMNVYSGSAAESYARSNKLSYSVVDRSLKQLAFLIIAIGLFLAAVVFAVVLMARSRKGAPLSVRKAAKREAERKAEEGYESIIDDENK